MFKQDYPQITQLPEHVDALERAQALTTLKCAYQSIAIRAKSGDIDSRYIKSCRNILNTFGDEDTGECYPFADEITTTDLTALAEVWYDLCLKM